MALIGFGKLYTNKTSEKSLHVGRPDPQPVWRGSMGASLSPAFVRGLGVSTSSTGGGGARGLVTLSWTHR